VRLVLDSNVVLSALLWRGAPHRLLLAIGGHPDVRIFTSPVLVEELADVLSREKLAERLALIGRTPRELLADFVTLVDLVEPAEVPRVIAHDRDDDQVLAAAVEAGADLIVSGDTRHLLPLKRHRGIEIVTVVDALQRLDGLEAGGSFRAR